MREEVESRDVAAEEICVEDERQLRTVEATAGEDGPLPDELCFPKTCCGEWELENEISFEKMYFRFQLDME